MRKIGSLIMAKANQKFYKIKRLKPNKSKKEVKA